MTDDLYERYKEALRVGHVAVLRGALAEALEAYRSAASIAPSRALPHTSLGGVLLRLGHLEEALVEYAAAVARAPHDEGALLGQAEALTIAGQHVDAAQALDHVAEIQEAAGRLPEAADTLRRAVELDDAPDRARHQRGLLREIRLSAGDQAAEQLLARALRLRDEPSGGALEAARLKGGSMPFGGPGAPAVATSTAAGPPACPPCRRASMEAEPLIVDRPIEPAWPASDLRRSITRVDPRSAPAAGALESVSRSETPPAGPISARVAGLDVEKTAPVAEAELPAPPDSVSATGEPKAQSVPSEALERHEAVGPAVSPSVAGGAPSIEPILAAVGVMDGAFDTDVPLGLVGESQHQPTGDELLGAAEAADLAGDYTTLRSLLLWTARAYAREGRFDAGLDATHRLLQRAPGDVDAHLVLVELYVARDWNSLAAEKLVLLGRLAELNNDEETRLRLCGVASRVFPRDERLGALCA